MENPIQGWRAHYGEFSVENFFFLFRFEWRNDGENENGNVMSKRNLRARLSHSRLVVNKLNGFFEREESEEKLYRLPPEDVSVPSTAALSLSEMDFSFALAQKPKRKKKLSYLSSRKLYHLYLAWMS